MYKQWLAYLTLLSIQSHNRYSGVFVLKSTWSDGISPCYRSFWKFFLLKSWPFGSFLWDPDRKYSLTAFHLPWSKLCSPHSKFFSERSKFRTSGKSQKIEIVSFPFQLVSGEEVCFITNYLDNKWFSRHFEMNESQFTKTSSGSFMIDKDLVMCTSEKNNATFSSSLYPTITSQSLSQWAGRHLRWKKYPNMLRYTEGTGLMWGFRNLFQKFKILGDF